MRNLEVLELERHKCMTGKEIEKILVDGSGPDFYKFIKILH